MRRSFKWTITVLIIAAIAAGMGMGLYRAKKNLANAPVWKPRPSPVESAPVTEGDLFRTIRYLARLEAVAKTEIAPKISARIVSLEVDEGDVVSSGDLLARLDDRDIRAQIAAIEATIESSKARLAGAKAAMEAARNSLAFTKREYGRDNSLFEKDGISASVLEASRNRLDDSRGKTSQAEEIIRSIKQEIIAQQAQLNEARTRLSYTVIRADYAGTIRKQYAETGDMSMPGKPIFGMLDISSYKLGFDLVQEDLAQVQPGLTVLVHWPISVPEAYRKGTVSRIFPSLESDQTVRAEIDFACACPEKLKVGSLVPLEVIVKKESGMIVPVNALVPMPDGGQMLYAIRKGKLKQVPVGIVLRHEDRALVRGEIFVDEIVAVGEYLQWVRLHDGMEVSF